MSHSKPNVIILGGGVAGMAAAKTLDQLGIGVHLIEKRAGLGGHAFDWACMATDACRNCGACLSAELVAEIQSRPGISVHLNTSLSGLEKNESFFQANMADPDRKPVRAAAVLFSTGFVPFQPFKIPELGYGQYDNVITTADLNAILKQEALASSLPDSPSPAIAFIQCVGSRNRKLGRDYCSQVCCKTAVRQADKILHLIPDANITLFHMDLQIIGKAFRTHAAEVADRVNLRQGVPAKILSHFREDKLSIIHEDPRTGARIAAHFDLVVLAVGMEPPAETRELARQLGISADEWGFLAPGDKALAPGVYSAGTVQEPMDILTAREQGIAAAHRIAGDLGYGARQHDARDDKPTLAVLGGTAEAFAAAEILSREHYGVVILDPDTHTSPASSDISYHPHARLARMGGTVGDFQLSFAVDQEIQKVKAAAIVVATGAAKTAAHEPSDAIQTLTEFVREYDEYENNPKGLPDTITFWLDSRGPEWKAYSRLCLTSALTLRSQGKTVFMIMEKMLVHGLRGQRLYDQARHAGVRFLRVGDPSQVQVSLSKQGVTLSVTEATLPGTQLTVACQRLVIPEQVRPASQTDTLAQILGQSLDAEGYIQSANVRHRPVASPRRGIFFVGPCHDEVDHENIEAEILAIKAALAVLLANKTSLDQAAEIDEGLCARCLTCLRACPHGAVVLRDGFQPRIAAQACFGCGICVSSCPARAITAKSQDAQENTEVQSPTARTVVFACERSGALAARAAGLAAQNPAGTLEIITVPCAGRLDQVTLVQPLIDGVQNVIVAGCHEGNCRSMNGSNIAAARVRQMAAVESDPETAVSYHAVAANESGKLVQILEKSGFQKEEPHV